MTVLLTMKVKLDEDDIKKLKDGKPVELDPIECESKIMGQTVMVGLHILPGGK